MVEAEQFLGGAGLSEYGRLIVVRNPNASNATDWRTYVDDLKDNTPFHDPAIITSERRPADTADKLAGILEDGDLLYLVGGDGLANDVAQYQGRLDTPAVTTMFSPLGNACNAYQATIGSNHGDRPSQVLRHAVPRDIYPLRAVVGGEDSYERLALSIVSVGAVATGASVLEQERHRTHRLRRNPRTRLAYETYVSLCKALPRLRTLQISDVDGTNERLALDILAAAAPVIAKLALFDTEITDFDFVSGNIQDKLPWHLLPAMVRMTRGSLPVVRHMLGNDAVSFRLTDSHRNREAYIEFDGEVASLAHRSLVSIDQVGPNDASHRPIRVMTTP